MAMATHGVGVIKQGLSMLGGQVSVTTPVAVGIAWACIFGANQTKPPSSMKAASDKKIICWGNNLLLIGSLPNASVSSLANLIQQKIVRNNQLIIQNILKSLKCQIIGSMKMLVLDERFR